MEDARIARWSSRSPPPPAGPGDDAAVLPDGTVVTVDALVEGVHFDARLSAEDVGYKAVAVNVSDIAAMGARPTWALLSVALPASVSDAWLESFSRGLDLALAEWGVALVGGDTTRSSGPVVVSITMGGRPAAAPVLRSGARAGDDLWVTGTLGLAALGWWSPQLPSEAALSALRRPRPSPTFACAVAAEGLATAMLDLSDGLASDLPRLCRASGIGATIDPDALPATTEIAAHPQRLALQVAGGDDYELLFAARPDTRARIEAIAAACHVRVTRIGACTSGPIVLAGTPWPPPLFEHFAERSP